MGSTQMYRKSDSVGRTVTIAVIAGVLFAGFLALTPRLTAGSQPAEAGGPVSVATPASEMAQSSISDPAASVPDSGLFDGVDEEPIDKEWDEPVTTSTTIAAGPEPDGTLTLAVELLGPRGDKEAVILEDEDTVEWHFRVENSGSEKLWGVYVYLEGYGHVRCDVTYLSPGDTAVCWARGSVWVGANTADAWATAWTTERQVAARLSYEYLVGE